MKEGKLPDPKERENEIDLGQKLQLDRDKEFQRRLKEAQGADYVEPEMATTDSSSQSSPKSKGSTSASSHSEKAGKTNEKKSENKRSKVIDYVLVIFFMVIWFSMFMYRNYPGLLGVKPKAPV